MFEKIFDDAEVGKWESRTIPEGMEIIGMFMSKLGDEIEIKCLGFIVWKPSL